METGCISAQSNSRRLGSSTLLDPGDEVQGGLVISAGIQAGFEQIPVAVRIIALEVAVGNIGLEGGWDGGPAHQTNDHTVIHRAG